MNRRSSHSLWLVAALTLCLASAPPHPATAETGRAAEKITAEAREKKLKAIIREFPRVYALTDPATDRKTFALRLSISLLLLAERFAVPLEVLKQDLTGTAKSTLRDGNATRMERAAAFFIIGDFAKAESLALAAGDEAHRDQPRRPPTIIEALQLAAFAAIVQRHYADAHRYLRVAMGETHPDRDLTQWAEVQVTQAHLEWLSNQPDLRIRTLRSIHAECLRSLGDDHAATLRHHNELAGALYDHSRDAEAEKEFRAILAVMERITGDHDDSAIQTLRKNLAKVIEAQDRAAEALELRERIVQSQVRSLGPDHPFTLDSRFDAALNLLKQHRYEDAVAAFASLVDDRQRVLGKDHPEVLLSRLNLALTLRQSGRSAEALTQYRVLHAAQTKAYGADSPRVLETATFIGSCLNELHQAPEAEKLLKATVTKLTKAAGWEAPLTLDARQALAASFVLQDKWRVAEKDYRSLLETMERLYGSNHTRTLFVRNKLASLLVDRPGGINDLLQKERETVARLTETHGPEHSATLGSRYNVAGTLAQARRYEEAQQEYQEVLKLLEKTLGLEHPLTVNCRAAAATIAMAQKRFADAESELSAVLEIRKRLLEPENPTLHLTSYCLGIAQANLGKIDQALESLHTAYAGLEAATGAEDAQTIEAKRMLDLIASMKARPDPTGKLNLAPLQLPSKPLPTINAPLKLKL
jgi:tetratricopeptide (TPR) repeat protein